MNNYANKPSSFKVGIVGARGYSGLELARICLQHPSIELVACYANDSKDSKPFKLSDYLPHPLAAQIPTLPISEIEKSKLHTLFLATPAEVSLDLAPQFIQKGIHVIDLSGAFRLEANQFPKWYGFEHSHADLLSEEAYGLVPFQKKVFKPYSSEAVLVSNPGCYVTSVLMPLIPLLALIQPQSLVIDAKSGTTGAGRKANETQLFAEVEGECLPYKISKHQHFPEICKYAYKWSGIQIDPHFSTSLLSVRRGIITSLFSNVQEGITEKDIAKAYQLYSENPLVKVSSLDQAGPYALSLKQVVGTARTHIRYKLDGHKLYVFSLIDNLMKGAASQAIENFNLLISKPHFEGLTSLEGTL